MEQDSIQTKEDCVAKNARGTESDCRVLLPYFIQEATSPSPNSIGREWCTNEECCVHDIDIDIVIVIVIVEDCRVDISLSDSQLKMI